MGKITLNIVLMAFLRTKMNKRYLLGGIKYHWRKNRKYELSKHHIYIKISKIAKLKYCHSRGYIIKITVIKMSHGNFCLTFEFLYKSSYIFKILKYNRNNNLFSKNNLPH